jgi:hypothetical protein
VSSFHHLGIDDLDGLANMLIGCAISNCIDVYKTISADAPLQAAGAHGQGACRQRSQGLFFVTLEANGGPFPGCAVDPPIGDLDHPCRQMAFQLLERGE